MQLQISEKIKRYRKEMELTQEGLAEAIGVTVGAVSKWENGNTVPDIMTLMQLANFFNISMDELLGFDLTSKNIDDMCDSIDELTRNHEFDRAITEANNAMIRYPHNFKVLYSAANLYYYRYLAMTDKKDSEKAISLFKTAMDYISQNEDHSISEYTIKFKIAYLYRENDPEKAVELLKQINYDGNNYNAIAVILSEDQGKTDEALEYFTYALIKSFSEQLNVVFNISSVLSISGKKADVEKAVDMVSVELNLVEASAIKGTVNYTYKIRAMLHIVKACLHSKLEQIAEMEDSIQKAFELADTYDKSEASPEIATSIRFFFTKQKVLTHDTTGVGAVEGIDNILMVKMKDKSGKNRKPIKRVLDSWNSRKSGALGK